MSNRSKSIKTKPIVGIIGCGTIGSHLASVCIKKLQHALELRYISEHDPEKIKKLKAHLKKPLHVLGMRELISRSDFIIEAAGPEAAKTLIREALPKGKQILIMSVGALSDISPNLLKDVGGNIWCPSGAVSGIDALQAASLGRLREVKLITRKPPASLSGAPEFERRKNLLGRSKKKELCVFKGSADQAVRVFPHNINVAMILALAGLGAKKTRVEIWTSRAYTQNTHELSAHGTFGSLFTRTDNYPSKPNPKTSELAFLSAEATLHKAFSHIKIGT